MSSIQNILKMSSKNPLPQGPTKSLLLFSLPGSSFPQNRWVVVRALKKGQTTLPVLTSSSSAAAAVSRPSPGTAGVTRLATSKQSDPLRGVVVRAIQKSNKPADANNNINISTFLEYNNLNAPPSPTGATGSLSTGGHNSPPGTSPSAYSSGGVTLSTLEKYSNVLISELKKKPLKEKLLRDALNVQERISSFECQLRSAEADTQRKRQNLQDQLEELEKKKEETRKNMDMLGIELDKTREETRQNVDALKNSPDFLDKNGIDRITREIEQLTFHACKIRTVSGITTTMSCDNLNLSSPSSQSMSLKNGLRSTNDDDGDISAICPVCLTIPDDQIFTCVICDNLICGSCRGKVTSCPSCRKSFKNNNAPRRNRLAEKLIASRK